MTQTQYFVFYMSSGLPSGVFDTFDKALDEAERNCAPGDTAIILRLVHGAGSSYVTRDYIFNAVSSDFF